MEAVEGLLADNPEIAAIAEDAYACGVTRRYVRESLGRGLLAALWYAHQEGCGQGDPNKDVAHQFRKQLEGDS
jgi:hypothetical protein